MAAIDITNPEFAVGTSTSDAEVSPSVTRLTDGSVIVVWYLASYTNAPGSQIQGEHLSADGSRLGDLFSVGTSAQGFALNDVKVAALTDGGFVATWAAGSDADIYAERFDANAISSTGPFKVNLTTDGIQDQPSITSTANGGFTIGWHDESYSGDAGVYVRAFAASGTALGSDTHIATGAFASDPNLIATADDGILATWTEYDGDARQNTLKAQHVDALGLPAGNAIRLDLGEPGNDLANGKANNLSYFTVVALTGGGFVAAWQSDKVTDGQDFFDVHARIYGSDGTPISTRFTATTTLGQESAAAIVALSNGGFVVSWTSHQLGTSGYDVFAQQFDAHGMRVGSESSIPETTTGNQLNPSDVGLDGGDYLLTWSTDGAPVYSLPTSSIDSRIIHAAGAAITGTSGDDTIVVSQAYLAGTSLIDGGAGNDTLITRDAAIDLSALAISGIEEILSTNPNGTRFVGTSGNDHITGQGAHDSLQAAGVARDFTLSGSLNNLTVSGPGGNDRLSGIEEVKFQDSRVDYDIGSDAATIYRFYTVGLDRAPDQAGLDYWVDSLQHNQSTTAIAQGFTASAEWQSKFGSLSNADFVTAMYTRGLDRQPDAQGYNFWLGELNAGYYTRTQVFEGFVNSSEAVEKTKAAVEGGIFSVSNDAKLIDELIKGAFGRSPTHPEFAAYVTALQDESGHDLAASIASTGEFTSHYGSLTDAQFVDALYMTSLGRHPEAEGDQFWLHQLATGESRADVFFGIAASAEHHLILQPTFDHGIALF